MKRKPLYRPRFWCINSVNQIGSWKGDVAQIVKKVPAFMQPEVSLTCSRKPTSGGYPESAESNLYSYNCLFEVHSRIQSWRIWCFVTKELVHNKERITSVLYIYMCVCVCVCNECFWILVVLWQMRCQFKCFRWDRSRFTCGNATTSVFYPSDFLSSISDTLVKLLYERW
jgi:hypothetical protein